MSKIEVGRGADLVVRVINSRFDRGQHGAGLHARDGAPSPSVPLDGFHGVLHRGAA